MLHEAKDYNICDVCGVEFGYDAKEREETERVFVPVSKTSPLETFDAWFAARPTGGYSSESLAREVWDYLRGK